MPTKKGEWAAKYDLDLDPCHMIKLCGQFIHAHKALAMYKLTITLTQYQPILLFCHSFMHHDEHLRRVFYGTQRCLYWLRKVVQD